MTLERALGSRNRVRMLRALFRRDGTSGRSAALRAGLAPSAAKAALEELTAAGIVLRTDERGRGCHEINRSHRLTPALERLFGEEERLSARLPAALRASLRGIAPAPELHCVGVSREGEVTLALAPVPPRREVETAVGGLLRFEYGLRLAGLVADPLLIPEKERLWSLPTRHPAPVAEEGERERALRFFGIAPPPNPAGVP